MTSISLYVLDLHICSMAKVPRSILPLKNERMTRTKTETQNSQIDSVRIFETDIEVHTEVHTSLQNQIYMVPNRSSIITEADRQESVIYNDNI